MFAFTDESTARSAALLNVYPLSCVIGPCYALRTNPSHSPHVDPSKSSVVTPVADSVRQSLDSIEIESSKHRVVHVEKSVETLERRFIVVIPNGGMIGWNIYEMRHQLHGMPQSDSNAVASSRVIAWDEPSRLQRSGHLHIRYTERRVAERVLDDDFDVAEDCDLGGDCVKPSRGTRQHKKSA